MTHAPARAALACASFSLLVSLSGCGKPTSYEVVLELRPDSVSHYFEPMRQRYDACVLEAKKLALPVKPFTVAPADFLPGRTTVISDGKSFYKKIIGFRMIPHHITPERGCGTDIVKLEDLTIVHNGSSYTTDNWDGHPTLTLPEDTNPPNLAQFAVFTVPKTINGVPLKCAGPKAHPSQQESNWCIIDPDVVIAANANGTPLIAHQRLDFLKPRAVLGETPVSLKVGVKVDPAIFAQR